MAHRWSWRFAWDMRWAWCGHAPFWLATFLFVTAFTAIFEYPKLRSMALAPVYGAGTSLAVTWLFESVFLVSPP